MNPHIHETILGSALAAQMLDNHIALWSTGQFCATLARYLLIFLLATHWRSVLAIVSCCLEQQKHWVSGLQSLQVDDALPGLPAVQRLSIHKQISRLGEPNEL